MRAARLALLVPALLLAGCSSSGSDGDDQPRRTTTTTAAAPTTTTTSSTVPFDGTTATKSIPVGRQDTALLRTIDVSSSTAGDSVTFNFLGNGLPKVDVSYVSEAVADGSGQRIRVGGDAILKVRFEPAGTEDLRGERPVPVYQGGDRIPGEGTGVVEVVKGGSFEGVVTFYVGVRGKRAFRLEPKGSFVSLVVAPG
jgi:hypothetical protein